MFSDPVVGNKFFGRRELIELLHKRAVSLKSGYRQNVALIGHQQLGKTSILRHFLHTLNDPELLCIYVEIKFQALDYFVDQFLRSLLYQALAGKETAGPMDSVSELIRKSQTHVPRTAARAQEITQALKARHPEEAYSKLFELTSVLRQETGRYCIVVIDEFHRLGEFGLKNAFSDFGKRIMVQKDTMYLLASSSFAASRRILAEKLALLFGNFERVYLEPFDFNTSFEFLDTKLAPLSLPELLKTFLVSFTDGHPFFLDTIARRVREIALSQSLSQVTPRCVAEALRSLLFESQGVLNQYMMKLVSPWTGPSAHGCHLLILTELACDHSRLKDLSAVLNRSQHDLKRQIEDLMRHELIIKNGVFHRFHNRIFKFWLREVYRRRELSLAGLEAGADEFLERVETTINEWAELRAMLPIERISRLFMSFKNDIVELGEKKRVLPHFTELKSDARDLVAKGHGRCWICRITEGRATEREVLELLSLPSRTPGGSPTKVLVALSGMEDNAKLLAKDKRVLTLGLSKLNMLFDLYGAMPLMPGCAER